MSMAPTVPTKRRSIRAKASARLSKPTSSTPVASKPSHPTAATLAAATSKQDRRTIKSSLFLHKVSKSSSRHPRTPISKARPLQTSSSLSLPPTLLNSSSAALKNHRRRANVQARNTISNLDALADALPELTAEQVADSLGGVGKVKMKSLRSGRGALRKKERVMKGEMERFGASLARIANIRKSAPRRTKDEADEMVEDTATPSTNSTSAAAPATNTTADRWAALRGFISSTIEQNPAFAKT